jgi:hypothetical protein
LRPALQFRQREHVAAGALGELALVRLKAVCGPGDQGEPVLSVMVPDED